MKGYYINEGYMGLVGTKYVLFVNEEEYKECFMLWNACQN